MTDETVFEMQQIGARIREERQFRKGAKPRLPNYLMSRFP